MVEPVMSLEMYLKMILDEHINERSTYLK